MMRDASEPLTALAPLALLTKTPTCRVTTEPLAAVVVKVAGVVVLGAETEPAVESS